MSLFNPLAVELNDAIKKNNRYLYDMLSEFGLQIYFPKGILSQGAEARKDANKTNATIGIATEHGVPMHLDSIQQNISQISPKDSFDYAPASGRPDLRTLWRNKMLEENPLLKDKIISNPIVTNGLTHGLSLVADLFINPGDIIILPDKLWENYELMYSVRYRAKIKTYPFYNSKGEFNTEAFRITLLENSSYNGKILVLLNFPNNPTGYTPTPEEAKAIANSILDVANLDCNIIALCDDAYFGLFYDDNCLKESISGYLSGLHPRVFTIKADAATKEVYVWGFRLGFLTYCLSSAEGKDEIFNALERKTMGAIRSSISNCPMLSQTLVLESLKSPKLAQERSEKAKIMKARGMKAREALNNDKYKDAWEVYPFNSGYFMCLKLKSVDSEQLRKHLLSKYGVGVISLDKTDLRVAFSCVEEEDIQELFDTIYKGIKDLTD